MNYTVIVNKRTRFGDYAVSSLTFKDEKKARDYYTDMLLKHPSCNVEFLKNDTE